MYIMQCKNKNTSLHIAVFLLIRSVCSDIINMSILDTLDDLILIFFHVAI